MARILFVHQNFPAQYRHLAPALAARGHGVAALSIHNRGTVANVRQHRYAVTRQQTPGLHPLIAEHEVKTIRGSACAGAALALRKSGFNPDVVCGHPGWGETLFLRDVFPNARHLLFLEFFYHCQGFDNDFDPEFRAISDDEEVQLRDRMRIRAKNQWLLTSMEAMDWGLSPTAFQASSMPDLFRKRISVIHDGIDTAMLKPDPQATFTTPGGRVLAADDEVVTFVNRNLEPYRGYHQFMRALPTILTERPNAQVLIVGGDSVSYGQAPPAGQTWKQIFLNEVQEHLDMSRVHFVGRVPYNQFVSMLRISSVHVYLTYPFVLSWSALEAMSLGCAIVGSNTAPVREVIAHGETGILVDFFDPAAVARAVVTTLSDQQTATAMGRAARAHVVEHYDLKTRCLPQHVSLVETLARGEEPTPSHCFAPQPDQRAAIKPPGSLG